MNADVIKSFLVSLGFDVDESGQRKFEATLVGATTTALKAGAAIEGAALSVLAFTAKIASGLDKLYWASQRTGSSVEGLKALSYAAVQAGGSADAARNSLEGLSRFMRHNPGAEGFLNRLGVQTRDASGKMRDMSAVFTGVGQQLNKMPLYRANQYAQMLGIDENTLLAMRRGLGQYQGEFTAMAKAIGFNADRAAASSNRFMTSLKSFGEMAGMARDKIGSNLADGLADSLDTLRKRILDNFPKIEGVLTTGIRWILNLAGALNHFIFRVIQGTDQMLRWWRSLDSATRDLIKLFGGLVVALKLLNSTFWMSPIGLITALAGAIFLLWDDYQTWREGGKSLIDWGAWKPEIDAAMKLVGDLQHMVGELAGAMAHLLGIDPKAWSLKWDFSNFIDQMGEFGKMLNMIADLLNAVTEGRWSDAAKIGKQLWQQGADKPAEKNAVTANAEATRQGVIDWYTTANDQLNRFLPTWLGGAPAPESVNGDNIQPDIPGAPAVPPVVPTTTHTGKDPQLDDLNRTQEKARQEAAKQREDAKLYPERSGGMLGKIADGIGRMVDGLFPPAAAAEITPNIVTSDVGHDASVNARGIRNNNPGNLNFAGQAGAQLEGPGGRFARFETAFDGIKAMARQLLRYFDGKTTGTRLQTIRDIISTWAPSKDNNNTEAYINALSKKLGVRPDAVLNLRDPQMLSQLMNGIIHHENGSNPYQRELVNAAATSATGKAIEIHQQNTYHITGQGAVQIGSEVEQRQLNANTRTMRTAQARNS